MFGYRRSHRGHKRSYGSRGGRNFGMLLLGLQLFNFFQYLSSRDEFIPTTLIVIALNVLMFLRPDIHGLHRSLRLFKWPLTQASCVSVQTVWYQGQWDRVLLAPFVHGDSWHLYYNMASFIWKSRTLERHFGTWYYAYLTSVFTVLSSLTYLFINFIIAESFDSLSYVRSCAVGFSGVIFALKVVTTHLEPSGVTSMFGIPVPKRIAVWGELVVISVLFPRASFTGHLAGILVGLAFVSGPLKQIMDLPIKLLLTHSGYFSRDATPLNSQASYHYVAKPTGVRNVAVPSNTTGTTDDKELQEAIRRSLNNDGTTTDYPSDYRPPPPYNPAFLSEENRVHQLDQESNEFSVEDLRNARLRKYMKSSTERTVT